MCRFRLHLLPISEGPSPTKDALDKAKKEKDISAKVKKEEARIETDASVCNKGVSMLNLTCQKPMAKRRPGSPLLAHGSCL